MLLLPVSRYSFPPGASAKETKGEEQEQERNNKNKNKNDYDDENNSSRSNNNHKSLLKSNCFLVYVMERMTEASL